MEGAAAGGGVCLPSLTRCPSVIGGDSAAGAAAGEMHFGSAEFSEQPRS